MDDLVRKENSVCDDKEFVLLSVCLCLCDMIVFFYECHVKAAWNVLQTN